MDRRDFLRAAGLGAAAGVSGCTGGTAVSGPAAGEAREGPGEAPAGRRMNVVLVMADDVGYECFGCYGSEQYRTPRLDSLAAGGVRFTNCHSNPLCTPSRVKIMTGRSNIRNYVDFGVLRKGERTFAHMLKDAGYATAVGGKWQLYRLGNKPEGQSPTEAGFDTYCLWHTPLTSRSRYWSPSVDVNGKLMENTAELFGPDVYTESLTRFIAANRERPFLAYYPMALPHSPFVPTPASRDRKSRNAQRNFEDMVAYIDTCVGRIVDALDEHGLRENTVVMFTGDNGTHRSLSSRLGERVIAGGKGRTLDSGTHVPLIVSCPGTVQAGLVSEDLDQDRSPASPAASHPFSRPARRAGRPRRSRAVVVEDLIDFADFLPTIAEVTGAKPPAGVTLDGRSFWPQCLGRKGDPREWVYCYYFPRPRGKTFDKAYKHGETRFARDVRWKLYGDGRLFDVVKDPLEERPVGEGQGGAAAQAARRKLRAAIESMPERPARIGT